ncbi:Aquaporin [Caenorhabditis elegans]|uniref:Aquaporin n=2 Tax=Caenorhabditis elegans TaxID=6239 RepID=H2FLH4_CAEEL|nr:Aquaporin [Caenorhabditis elegans]CCF23336.1 Aquaporin [Caenorhabditis elegans]|eukprot:NP_001256246.1 AQuaPorin or aquaglyceroporin related [Caenorhabditis elegans]
MEVCPVYPDSENIPSPMVRSASDVILNSDPFNSTMENLKNSSDIVPKMVEDEKDYTIYSKCAAEFIAVLLFVYIGSMQAAGVFLHDGVLHAAFAHGVAIFVLAATFGGVSGAHINPAVTFGIALVGRISPIHAVCYVVSQLLGSVFGALLVRISLPYKMYNVISAGATLCGKGYNWQEGLTAEIVTTYILVQTVLLCAVDTDKNRLAPLAIGFSLIIEILAAGAISGASMNPARSFGPNIMGQVFLKPEHLDAQYMYWNYHWIYYIGPIIGAFIAAGVYRMFFARDYRVLA